jgi:hypothetical protein
MKRSTTLMRSLLAATAFVVVWGPAAASGDPLNGALYGLAAGVVSLSLLQFIFNRNQDAFRLKVEKALKQHVDPATLTGYASGFTGQGRSITMMSFGLLGGLLDGIFNGPSRVFYILGCTPDRLIVLQKKQAAPRIYRRNEVLKMEYSGNDLSENVLHLELSDEVLDILIEAGAGRTVAEEMVSSWHGGRPMRDDKGKLLRTN